MKGQLRQEKITMRLAAKALGVSERTLQRYISKGLLTKIREGYKIYLLADEVRQFRQGKIEDRLKISKKDNSEDIVTIRASKFYEIMSELGELKEKCNYLLEYKLTKEKLEKELDHTRGILEENDGFLRDTFEENKKIRTANESQHNEIEELKKNLQAFQRELDRLKRRGLIKRIFNK